MYYRKLGQTGLNVSVIGFGASPLGNVFGPVSNAESNKAVGTAIDRGVNFFDVSPYYGLTLAEEKLGEALKGRREEITLATKCGRYGVDHFDFSAATITREFHSSLRRLQTDHVDLLQAHDVEFVTADRIVDETIPAMRRLQKAGKVRFVGITGYWPGLLASIAERADVDCILNYCHGNLLMWDMEDELVPMTERKGIGLINASPLHMGLLGGREISDWHPAPPAVRVAAQQMREACKGYGLNPATVAQAWCLMNPAVSSTLVGISSVQDLNDSLDALQLLLPETLVKELRAIAMPVAHTTWASGLAQNQPAGIAHAR